VALHFTAGATRRRIVGNIPIRRLISGVLSFRAGRSRFKVASRDCSFQRDAPRSRLLGGLTGTAGFFFCLLSQPPLELCVDSGRGNGYFYGYCCVGVALATQVSMALEITSRSRGRRADEEEVCVATGGYADNERERGGAAGAGRVGRTDIGREREVHDGARENSEVGGEGHVSRSLDGGVVA